MEVTPAKAEHRDAKLLKRRTCKRVRGNTKGGKSDGVSDKFNSGGFQF